MDVVKSILIWFAGIIYIFVFFLFTFVIWLLTLPFDSSRRITHTILVWQSYLFCRLIPFWNVSIEGREKARVDETYVIISNHQSILDILVVNSLRYNFKWISKIENMKVPVLGWYLRMAGYISVDRGNRESKDAMLARSYLILSEGTSLMMFPEGTRSVDGEIGFFKRGAFQLAIQAGKPILPVIIDGTGGILPKHGLIFSSGHKISLRVFDPVYPRSFGTTDPDELAQIFCNFMRNELKRIRSGQM